MIDRIRCRAGTFLVSLLLLVPSLTAAEAYRPDELRIGLVPALSPQRFVQGFSKMVTYLEDRLGIEAVLVGAPNYAEFIRRAEAGGHYDMIISGADIYRYLDRNADYRAIVRLSGPGNYAIIASAADSGLTDLADLRGKTIATADPLSLSRRLGENTLREAGIIFGENAQVLVTPTQNASVASILSGLADAAIFMDPALRRASPEGPPNSMSSPKARGPCRIRSAWRLPCPTPSSTNCGPLCWICPTRPTEPPFLTT